MGVALQSLKTKQQASSHQKSRAPTQAAYDSNTDRSTPKRQVVPSANSLCGDTLSEPFEYTSLKEKVIMKKYSVSAIVLFIFAFTSSISQARTYPDKKSGVQVSAPDNWKAGGDSDTLELSSPDGMANLMFTVMEAKDIEQAVKERMKELEQIVKNFKQEGKEEEKTINGLKVFTISGVGTVEGVKMKLAISMAVSSKGKIVLMLGICAQIAWQDNKQAILSIVNSVRPIK